MKLCQITINDPIIKALCQIDFSETLSESVHVSAQTLKVGYLDKSFVLKEDHDNSLDHCYDPSI